MEHIQQAHPQNKEALRSLYDNAYRLIFGREKFEEAVRTAFDNNHVRKTGRVIVLIGMALLGLVLFFASNLLAQHILWLNRPSADDLLAAPYSLSNQSVEIASFATGSTTLATLQNAGFTYISDNANLPLVVCLGSTTSQVGEAVCPVPSLAMTTETALLLDPNNKSVTMVVATFADEVASYDTLRALHSYSRTIGRDGNFVLSRSQDTPYFFSQHNSNLNFTWMQNNTIYLISATDTNTIDTVIEALRPSTVAQS